MCHFCPVEIQSLGLGAGRGFLVLPLFLFVRVTPWQQYIGKKGEYGFCKTMYHENVRKHNCIWGPASWRFPVKNKTKQQQKSIYRYGLGFELGKLRIPKDLSKDI